MSDLFYLFEFLRSVKFADIVFQTALAHDMKIWTSFVELQR
jgi:hypothetical protein